MILSLLLAVFMMFFGYLLCMRLLDGLDFIQKVFLSFLVGMIFYLSSFYVSNFIFGVALSRWFVLSFFLVSFMAVLVFSLKNPGQLKKIREGLAKEEYDVILIFLFILVLVLLTRLYPLPEFMLPGTDAGYHLSLSNIIVRQGISTFDPWNYNGVPNIYPPMFHLFASVFHISTGEGLIGVFRFLILLFSGFFAMGVYSVVKLLTGDKISSFVASALSLFSPVIIWLSFMSLYGQLFGRFMILSSVFLLLLFLKKKNASSFLLFSFGLSVLALGHTESFLFGLLITGFLFFFHVLYEKRYGLLRFLPIFFLLLLALPFPWYFQLAGEFAKLSSMTATFPDIGFGDIYFMVGWPVILLSLAGAALAVPSGNRQAKGFIFLWPLLFGFLHAGSLGIAGIRQNFLLSVFSIAAFILAGFAVAEVLAYFRAEKGGILPAAVFAVILVMLSYQFVSGFGSLEQSVDVYLSREEYNGIVHLNRLLAESPETTVLSDEPYSGFRYWVLGLSESRVITDGWDPNAIDNFGPVENAGTVFDPGSTNMEIYGALKDEGVGFIIVHKDNENIKRFENIFTREFENMEVEIFSTGV